MTADTLERLIALEGAVNFRDLGGYCRRRMGGGPAGASSSAPTAWAS